MSSQQHSQSFEDDCSLSDFDTAGLSLCNVSETENFTGNSNLETQTGSVTSVEIVNVTNEGVQSASHDPTSYPSSICLPFVLGGAGEEELGHDPLWNLSSRNRVTPVSIQDGV